MAVYVDELRHYPNARIPGWWCHMTADTHDELMAFARRIGLKPAWLQYPGKPLEHFDIRGERMRAKAIKAGAKPISLREAGRLGNAKVNAAIAAKEESR
jgi:hypothetical protein